VGKAPDDLIEELPAAQAEIDTLRERTQAVAAELERRLRAGAETAKDGYQWVKRATDVRAQIKAHPRIMLGASTALALALGLGIYLAAARRREARRPINRLKGRLHHYRALLGEPQRAFAKQAPLGQRLVAAVLIAGATTIVRGFGMLLFKQRPPRAALPPAPEV
jgi:hypothetical protein